MSGFIDGVNLGGWLSQYREFDHEHFRTFITRPDIDRIASWGMDHVRLPVDYPVLESDDAIGVPVERGYSYIDDCLQWCEAADLAMILDIHHAPGFTFTNELEEETRGVNSLFDDESLQQRFIGLWEQIVRRYRDSRVPIIFELLNEVVIPDVEPWNVLIRRTIPAIRAIAPDSTIMIGGNFNNGVPGLKDLVVFDDPKVVYTFHFYDPLLFTHQKAYWNPGLREWGETVSYPGEFPGLAEFLERNPQHRADFGPFVGRRADRELVAEILQPALDFAERTGRELYCGEFGVGDWIEPENRRRWLADFMGMLREAGIGRAVWNYKQMDFGLVDADGQVVDPEYLRILTDAG
ncbi:MAG: cellulase family glycosylhydrolase [Demequinaceae bacterium]|nr:cellulase family glycosylhydrolase [Demequinaceae bacterium]